MKNICNTCKYEIYEFCKKVGLESIDKNGKCFIYKEDVYKEHGLRKVEVIEINRYRELDSDTPNNKSFIAYFHKWFESENELYAIVVFLLGI